MTAPSEDPEPREKAPRPNTKEQPNQTPLRDEEFRDLYRRIVPQITAFLIVAYGAGRREAAECAHEALAEYHEKRDEVRYPSAWCRRAARSTFLRRMFSATESFADFPATGAPLYSSADADRVDDDRQRHRLLLLIAKLPPRQREITALILQGLEYHEIAVELDQPESTVRSHARHARQQLAGLHRISRRQHREGHQ